MSHRGLDGVWEFVVGTHLQLSFIIKQVSLTDLLTFTRFTNLKRGVSGELHTLGCMYTHTL